MTEADVLGYVNNDAEWMIATRECRRAFFAFMRDKQYGRGPTLAAWHAFCAGWRFAVREVC